MLDILRTVNKFGYDPNNLAKGSHKLVIVVCDYCGEIIEVTYKTYNNGRIVVKKDCCGDCKFIKRKDVCFQKYGVYNSSQRPEVKQKISNKAAPRLQSQEFKDKYKTTMLKKYGVEHCAQSKIIRDKTKETCMAKYGVETPLTSKECIDKSKKTCLEKYGCEYAASSDIVKQKIKDSIQDKYGCDNIFQTEYVKEKSKITMLEKYGVTHHLKNKEKAKINAKKGIETKIQKGYIKSSNIDILTKPIFIDVVSNLLDWLNSIGIAYYQYFKIKNTIADIYIPHNNLIIEIDRLYWHSEQIRKDNNYHVKKRQLYIDNGYSPLFFRENEIVNNFNIVQSIILNKLNMSKKIGARKCKIVEINNQSANIFFNQNHLMGKGAGKTYGLEYNGDLVTALRIKKYNKGGYEISRFCHTLNISVIGGLSKLISYISHKIPNENISTFIDLRYGSGEYLTGLGFIKQKTYPSFKWTNGSQLFNRMQFPASTGYDKGLVKIWDCGQAKFVKFAL